MFFPSFQKWLNAAPLNDAIERRLSPLIQIVLIALAVASALMVIVGLVIAGGAALSAESLAPTLLFIAAALFALAVLRRGHFRTSLWIITCATLLAQARSTLAADLSTDGAILMAFSIPIALAGLLINRRSVLLVLLVSTAIVYAAALRDMPDPALAAATTLFFLIIYGLFSFLLGLFNYTFRNELAASLERAEDLQRLTERLARLQEVTQALSAALTSRQVADIMVGQALPMLVARSGMVTLVDDDGRALRILSGRGFPPDSFDALERLPLTDATPLSDAVRGGQSVWITSADEYRRRYPRLADSVQAMACLPMRYDGRVIGGLSVSFPEPRRFTDDERSFLLVLAHQCGLALERARLYEAELRAREDSERSRQQVSHILESITDAYFGLDRSGQITYVNREAERVLGRTRDSLLGRDFWAEFAPAAETELDDAYHRALADGVTVRLEYYYYAPVETWFEVRIYPAKDGLFVYLRDVNQRKHADKILRLSEQTAWRRLIEIEAIYNNAPVGLGVLDTELRFQRINASLAQMNGYTPAEHLGRTVRELLPNIADNVESKLRQVIVTGEPILNVEVSGETPALPGVRRNWVENWVPLKDQNGQVVGISIVAEEITERKRIEAAEREQRLLAESLRDITSAINSTLDLNEVLDRIMESVGRVVPHDAGMVLLVEDGVAGVQRTRGFEFDPALEAEIERQELPVADTAELQGIVEGGRPLIIPDVNVYPGWIQSSGVGKTPFRNFIGAPVYLRDELIGFINLLSRPATAFTTAQAERLRLFAGAIATALQNARLYQEAQEVAAYEERQRLARDLHDAVSQTLFSATTLAEALPRLWQINPQRTMEQLDQIVLLNRAAMAEMRTLLLELRPEALINTRLNRLLTQLVEVMQGRKRLTAELVIEGSENPRLPPGVHLAIYRIAQESLNNIVKHSQATRAAIHVRRSAGYISLRVQDNGRGFNPAARPAGLGLGMMRERAEAIGASLTVSSRPGEGTEVVVTWPGDSLPQIAAGA